MKIFLSILFVLGGLCSKAQSQQKIYWPEFLSRHDLIWDNISPDWYNGAFIGNGQLGAMIFKENDHAMRWDIGRSDVTDHREDLDVEWGKARLPIGRFLLKSKGIIVKNTMKLDLWNAEARGIIITDKGSVMWRSFVATKPDVIVIEFEESGSEKVQIEFVSEIAQSPRLMFDKKPNMYSPWLKGEYIPNPKPIPSIINQISTHQQNLLIGGGFSTAWKVIENESQNKKILFVSVGYSYPENTHVNQSIETIKAADKKGILKLVKTHQGWWHNYYPSSFLSIPDTRLESFYWIQQYKLAAATRSDKLVLDLMGPWYNKTPWPALWWNLNIQLNYSPVYTSNRLSLGESLANTLDANVQNFIKNVPEKFQYNSAGLSRVSGYDGIAPLYIGDNSAHQRFKEAGNLTWILHNYWMQCKYSGDEKRMVNSVYPLLRRSINYYLHILEEDKNGILHLPPTFSPEYTANIYPDCNYDLSLLRWGCKTLLSLNEQYKLNDTLAAKWRYVHINLTNYPQDNVTGLNIGLNMPLKQSHRHYSHLLMIYPLRILQPENPQNKELIEKSLAHWTGLKGAIQGYTFTGASSISSLLGKGNDALDYLNEFIDKYVQPNTFYQEAGPVIETPLSAAASINEMLLQSYNNEIHVFPAVPDSWKDVSFQDLRAEGAFLISAKRLNFQTVYVKIKSLRGGKLKLKIGSAFEDYTIRKSQNANIKFISGFWEIDSKKGEVIQLYSKNLKKEAIILPIAPQESRLNYFGSSKFKP